jgi:hypothetical protein
MSNTEQQESCCDAQLTSAREAWQRIQRTDLFSDWLLIGSALQIGQAQAMQSAKTNKPKGQRYCAEMSAFLKEYGLHEIDKGARSRLLEVMKHRAEIEAWHQALPIDKRVKLNHPQAVLSAWRRATAEPKETVPPEPKPELVGIWKNATSEDRRAAHDALGVDQFLEDLSPAMRADLETRLANPHTGKRLAEKVAEEKQTVEEAKDEIAKRNPNKGNATSYSGTVKSKRTKTETKTAKPKNIGQWRKFPREKLQAVYDQERQRMETEHLNVRELKRLEEMRERLTAFEKTDTSAVRQGNQGDPVEEARQRAVENAELFSDVTATVEDAVNGALARAAA